MGNRSGIDWAAIERDYRLGMFTLRELAAKHKLGHAAIGKRAARDGWVADQSDEVRRLTRVALIRDSTTKRDAERDAKETETVLADAVATNLVVVREHRGLIAKGQKIVRSLMGELDGSEIGLKDKSVVVGNLAGAAKTLIALERQAFNLDAATAPEGADVRTVEIVVIDP